MGRGRAKAKQTKVARNLKYQTFETDFNALAEELHADQGSGGEPEIPEQYAELADEYEDVDDSSRAS